MIDIYFVLLPHTVLLDLAGPAEAFRIANQVLNKSVGSPEKESNKQTDLDKFRLHFVGPSTTIASSIGVQVSGLQPLPPSFDTKAEQVWVALLGLPSSVKQAVIKDKVWFDTRRWLVKTFAPQLLATDQDRFKLVSVCAGALLAADAGLLSNRQCTTHHELLEQLRSTDSSAKVISNRVFVEDGPILTSGGITAGIDLALHLIAATCGSAVASSVAQVMVVFTRRGPLDPSESPLLRFRDHIHPAVHRIQDAICANPQTTWTSKEMATIGFVTPRHLLRLFTEQAGITPRDYVESVRASIARHALDKGISPLKAAQLSGLGSTRRLKECLSKY